MWIGIIVVFYELYNSNKHAVHTSRQFNLFREFSNTIFGNFGTFLTMSIPSILYGIQNNLLIVALHHLDSSIYQITYQCKTFSAALFGMFFLNKTYNKFHWMSFCLLAIGAASASYSAQSNGNSNRTHHHTHDNDYNSERKLLENDNNDDNGTGKSISIINDDRNIWIGLLCILIACIISGAAGLFLFFLCLLNKFFLSFMICI